MAQTQKIVALEPQPAAVERAQWDSPAQKRPHAVLLDRVRAEAAPLHVLAGEVIEAWDSLETPEDMWHCLDAVDRLPSGIIPGPLVFGTCLRLLKSPALFQRLRAYRSLIALALKDEHYRLHASRVLAEALESEDARVCERLDIQMALRTA